MLNVAPTLKRPIRINEELQQYWFELKGERALPLENEISIATLKDIWPACFLLTVREKNSFAYDYLGKDLLAAYGDDITGREITEALVYPHPPSLFSAFQEVCRNMQPAMDENHFTNSHGTLVKYRSCVLPFAVRGRADVAFLLGGMRWKVCDGA